MALQHAITELTVAANEGDLGLEFILGMVERAILLDKLQQHDWNQVQTAIAMEIHRNTLSRKMALHNIEQPDKPAKNPIGRRQSEVSKLAQRFGISERLLRANGLDKPGMSPLALRIRLKQLKKGAQIERRGAEMRMLSEKKEPQRATWNELSAGKSNS